MIRQGDKYVIRCENCWPLIIAEIPINPHGVTTIEVVIYNEDIICKPYVCPKCDNTMVDTFFEDTHRKDLSIEDIY